MTVPRWTTFKAAARVRVALRLHTEGGALGGFTTAELRGVFPKVEQIDRRMRVLRPEGWATVTYDEDRSLMPDGLRPAEEGGPAWQRGYRPRAGHGCHRPGAISRRGAAARCHVAARDEPPPAGDLLAQVNAIDAQQRQPLRTWVKQGARKQATEEQLWARCRRLPRDARQVLEERLDGC